MASTNVRLHFGLDPFCASNIFTFCNKNKNSKTEQKKAHHEVKIQSENICFYRKRNHIFRPSKKGIFDGRIYTPKLRLLQAVSAIFIEIWPVRFMEWFNCVT